MSVKFGVDVSQDKLDLAYAVDQDKARYIGAFDNNREGFLKLEEAILPLLKEHQTSRCHIVLEPTGGYESVFAHWAHAKEWMVSKPNPKQVKDWGQGKGQRSKTDKVDAKMLARYGWGNNPPQWHPMEAKWQELTDLLELQEECERQLRRVSNQLHALKAQEKTSGNVWRSLTRSYKHFEKELESVSKVITKKVSNDADFREQKKRLQSCPGVGEKIVLPLMGFLAKWSAMTEGEGSAKGLTAMAGLDPQLRSSGTSVRGKGQISKRGDGRIRQKMYNGARGGVMAKEGPLVEFYKRMRNKSKHSYKEAVVACARKILCWAWAVFRDQKMFDPSLASSR